jgi:sulfatase modifying factor 1
MRNARSTDVDASKRVPPAFRRFLLGGLSGVALLAVAALAPSQGKDRGPVARAARPEADAGGMVWVPGGRFRMGTEVTSDARPVHEVEVDGFWIDRTEVTNAEFARFVAATGYVTVAERPPDPKLYPGADPAMLVPGSIIFLPPAGGAGLNQPSSWWRYTPGADWRHPEGPGSAIAGREDHPVVQVGWDDAVAFARWAGKRLPTEAEWEYASRGGLEGARYVWGGEFKPSGRWQANIFQGEFPARNTVDDGFVRTAPVASFPPNGFGLHDMSGNVWEWCADWYRPDAYASSTGRNPTGPPSSVDPEEPGVDKRVQRGGSFLCSDDYCVRYLAGARGKGESGSAASHTGFRCVRSGTAPGLPSPHDTSAAAADAESRVSRPAPGRLSSAAGGPGRASALSLSYQGSLVEGAAYRAVRASARRARRVADDLPDRESRTESRRTGYR